MRPSAFFMCFSSNSVAYMELRIEPFIQSTEIDYYNSFNCVQVLNYSEYFSLFLPIVRTVPATSRWFHKILKSFWNNKEYLLSFNNCTRLWLTELEQSTSVDWIQGSVWSSVWAPEFSKKHLKKAEGHIDRNVLNITIKLETTVRIPKW